MQLNLVKIKWKYLIQKFHDICLSYYFKTMSHIIYSCFNWERIDTDTMLNITDYSIINNEILSHILAHFCMLLVYRGVKGNIKCRARFYYAVWHLFWAV
jgi:hypothetical protein